MCVTNDATCPAIEAQFNALIDIAKEVLSAKEMLRVEDVAARLGVTAERYESPTVYHLQPSRSTHAEFKVPHMSLHGTHTTTTFSTGIVSTRLSMSIDTKHACIGVDELKSRLPGGRDEVRSFAHFELSPYAFSGSRM